MILLHIKTCFYSNVHSRHALIRPFVGVRFNSSNIKSEIELQEEDNNAKIPSKKMPKLRFSDSNKNSRTIGAFGWLLLMVPAVTFALGTWQVRRKAWKEQLIAELRRRRDAQPVALPDTLDNLASLEYYPVHARGHFLHDRQMYLGPRTLLINGEAATEGKAGLVSNRGGGGYLVVTPFQLEGRKEMILVNRGWVAQRNVGGNDSDVSDVSDAGGATDVVGLVRLTEQRPAFMPRRSQEHALFTHRDLEQMALRAGEGCARVFLDATDDHLPPGGARGRPGAPLPNQTRVALRNEHLGYVVTWYGLSAATGLLWYRHFLVRR